MAEHIIKGEFSWIRVHRDRPEEFTLPDGTVKKSWSVTCYPDKESLELVRELQAIGIKNKVKRDEKGWFLKFSTPVEDFKKGKTTQNEPPKIYDKDNSLIEGFVNNGATGELKIDFREGQGKMGKFYTARPLALKLDTYTLWQASTPGNGQAGKVVDQKPGW